MPEPAKVAGPSLVQVVKQLRWFMNKVSQQINFGKVYITSGFNNTLITISDPEGRVLLSGSSGTSGFKGARKSTPFAASTTALSLAKKAIEMGLSEIAVYVKGPGAGRDAAIKSLKSGGLEITSTTNVSYS